MQYRPMTLGTYGPRIRRGRRPPITPSYLGAGVATQAATKGITAGVAMIPVVGPFLAPLVGPIASLISSPAAKYGACSTTAPDMISYLNCWKHAIPANFIPYPSHNAEQGWGWAYCPGAAAGSDGKDYLAKNANFGGCQPGCDCTGRDCTCAAPGQMITSGQLMPGGNYGGPAPATGIGLDGSSLGGTPMWEWVAGGGVLLLILLFAMRG